MNLKYEVKTNKTFIQAVDSLKASLVAHEFSALWELNFKDKLAEKELPFEANFKVLEVCNPKQAKEVLDRHIEAGYFLPCKIVVYEKDNSVFIGMMRPSELIGLLGQQDLISIAQDVENTLKQVIDKSV